MQQVPLGLAPFQNATAPQVTLLLKGRQVCFCVILQAHDQEKYHVKMIQCMLRFLWFLMHRAGVKKTVREEIASWFPVPHRENTFDVQFQDSMRVRIIVGERTVEGRWNYSNWYSVDTWLRQPRRSL